MAAWIVGLRTLRHPAEQLAYLEARPGLHHPQAVDELQLAVVNEAVADLDSAESLAQAAQLLADLTGGDHARAIATRARGHILYSRADYANALAAYSAAIEAFERLGRRLDAARTRNGAVQSLIYLGQYDRALEWIASAREVLLAEGDVLRAARCDLNAGNLHYRQDHYEEALALYRRAQHQFASIGTPRDIAAAYSNIAVCLIGLQDYDGALAAYTDGRRVCLGNGMALWVAEADYNIAYLHFLRGEYTQALRLYQSARTHCQQVGDHYHAALCDLDQAEMFLELNLLEEGAQLARLAYEAFTALNMRYESAKALAFLGLASGRRGQSASAIRLFRKARQMFLAERNEAWPAYLDLYRAVVRLEEGRYEGAIHAARQSLHRRSPLCLLILAKASLLSGAADSPARCQELLASLTGDQAPAIHFQAHFLKGYMHEAAGQWEDAQQSFHTAIECLDSLRTRLSGDDLKIAFLKDKLTVYEHAIALLLARGNATPQELLEWAERAKCRSLAELLRFQDPAAAPEPAAVSNLRHSLNACYRQLESAALAKTRVPAKQRAAAWSKIREYEGLLAAKMAESRALAGVDSLHDTKPASLDAIRAALPDDTVLIEYFIARGRLLIVVMDRHRIHTHQQEVGGRLASHLRYLRFQLAKFRLGEPYTTRFSAKLIDGALSHLRELHTLLIAPIRPWLTARHLVIVPHGALHHLPFAALHDGRAFLTDSFSLSFAPSATVFALCSGKPSSGATGALAMGIPDPATPFVEAEIRSVAHAVPRTTVLLGDDATLDALRQYGAQSQIVHIASHGHFRQDNPMFSFVQLGDTRLNLHDLYDLRLSADLVTLSGCSTGLSAITGGDEMLGLVRGLLYAGARSVMLSLWDVHDQSAARLVAAFYEARRRTPNQAEALQTAMKEVRATHPHPYFWAPFLISGNFFT